MAGYYWAVVGYHRGHRCGYVRIPPGHALNGKRYDDVPYMDVHGGLTLSRTGDSDTIWKMCNFPAGGTVYGFDCNHDMDLPDPELMPGYDRNKHIAEILMEKDLREGEIRTADYVESECRGLILELDKYKESEHDAK